MINRIQIFYLLLALLVAGSAAACAAILRYGKGKRGTGTNQERGAHVTVAQVRSGRRPPGAGVRAGRVLHHRPAGAYGGGSGLDVQ